MFADRISKSFGVKGSVHNKIKNCICERIIHNCIKLIALKPAGRFMPDLAENICIRVNSLNNLAEISPELVVNLVGYIQSPAVDADFFNPEFCHPK
ncbi:hypothetical protein D3C77_727270 [compost metagenome]